TYPLCATGADPDNDATGVSRPPTWTPSTFFAGRLVACERGFYARVAKSTNVEIAGGTGMILYNQQSEGDSLVSGAYNIPTVHLTYADGQSLLAWLNTGSGHLGAIQAASWNNQVSFGDKLASFSGRGPVIPTGVIKPDIAAPGVDIYAAGLGNGATCTTNSMTGTNCAVSESGTSMATPHVAGAMALIKAVNPSWTPSQIISSLVLTARASVTINGVVGTPHDIGAGQTDVSKAVRAGLYLPVSDAQFKGTSVATADTLNLPSLGKSDCFESCVLSRNFTDMVGGGSYTVVSNLPAGVTMTPSASNLTFTNGQNQSVNFTFNVTGAPILLGKWVYGSVTLQNNTPANGRPNLTLPVAIRSSAGAVPTSIEQNVSTERGSFDFTFSGLAALPNARFVAGDLVAPKTTTSTIAVDLSGGNPYNAGGTKIDTFTIPASPVAGPVTYKVQIKTSMVDTNATDDIDLYVGLDDNGDGLATSDEEICSSTTNGPDEICEFNVTTGGSPVAYWFLAQHYAGTASNVVKIDSLQAPIQAGTTGTLVTTGPGKTTSGVTFKSRISWDDPSLVAGQSRVGFLMVQAAPGSNAIEIPVTLTRTGTSVEPFALTNNVDRNATLTANAAHDKLYFVVPPHATSVTFTTTSGSNVDLYVAKSAVADDPNVSVIPAAPARNLAQGSAITASGNETVTLSGAALTPGRWYVTPVNTTGGTVNATVKANITAQGTPPAFLSGQYVNVNRDGHGMFIDFAGPIGNPDQWVTVWYSYLEDGTPTWYYTQAAVPTANGVWRANLLRVVWNGNAASATKVGDLIITETGTSTITVSYNLDGKSGSENMARVGGGNCPSFNAQNLDVSGHWYSPDKSGFGYSFIATGGGNPQEVMIPYIYDGLGFPRWIYGQKAFNSGVDTFNFQWFSGFAPTATKVSLTGTAAGSGTRTLATNNLTNMSVNSTLTGLLSGTWTENRPVAQLSQRKNCQ
ncbi:MAG: S8 family serine peptidase, partial [Arenimonas sp.]